MDEINEISEINEASHTSSTGNNSEDVLHKAEMMKLNNGWNDKNEQIIISIGENSASYKWMHEKCASHHKFVDKFMSILLIVLTAGLSAETIVPYNGPCSPDFTLDIIKRIIIYIVTVLSVLQTFFKSEEVSEKHLSAAGAFSILYHDIQQKMCMFRRDRINATNYVSECLKQYDSLVINNPDINSRVLGLFKKTFNNNGIASPDNIIQKIEIITEDIPMQMIRPQMHKDKTQHERKEINANTNGPQNCNNLAQIHNAFQIHGDISDKDLENMNSGDLKALRTRFFNIKSNYEYQRFLEHSQEND